MQSLAKEIKREAILNAAFTNVQTLRLPQDINARYRNGPWHFEGVTVLIL